MFTVDWSEDHSDRLDGLSDKIARARLVRWLQMSGVRDHKPEAVPARDGDRSLGWQPRQPHPGTRITRYRCFLPDLAGFASYRREGTDGVAVRRVRCFGHRFLTKAKAAFGRPGFDWPRAGFFTGLLVGGESGIRTREAGISRLHTFQACSFNHSDISPLQHRPDVRGGMVRRLLRLTPRSRSGPAWRLSGFAPGESVEPAKRG